MDFIQQNMGYIAMALVVAWMLWKRWLAPKLSGVTSISAGEYMKLRDQAITVVDVRSPGEWLSGHAPEAMHIPLGELAHRQHEIPEEKPVIVVCASGNRSAIAATTLARAGFSEVYNFSGGMGAWQSAGLPVKAGS